MKRVLTGLIFLLILLVSSGIAADFVCNGRLISEDDTKGEVLGKCGEPSWKEKWTEEVIQRLSPVEKHKTYVRVEEWYYNLGPGQFIRILRFENGVVVEVRTDGYGY